MTDRKRSALAPRFVAAANVEPRAGGREADMLILHYTGMADSARALDWLCRAESKVSCHYLIDERGGIVQMVGEDQRAWHAGQSYWHGETDINSCSIGIEIHNPGYDRGYPDFPEEQMQSVVELCTDIVRRHAIAPARVLAHSDIAPFRKIDPGHKFDWQRLALAGAGVWVKPEPITAEGIESDLEPADIWDMQRKLIEVGYGLKVTGLLDDATRTTVSAFQRHWRPASFDGAADLSTRRTLDRLLRHLRR